VASGFVTVEGYREVDRALRKVNRDKDREFRAEFAKAGEHVRDSARSKVARYAGSRTDTIISKALARGVFVVQNAPKVSGARGDYGALQMRHLLAARAEEMDRTVEALEDALDRVADRAGF
jgi:hypothetical protein